LQSLGTGPNAFYGRKLVQEVVSHLGIQSVAAAVSSKAAHEVTAAEGKVANHIQEFVAYTFVRETELIINRTIGVENEQVPRRCPSPKSL